MTIAKLVVSVIIFCGFLLNFTPDNFVRFGFECIVIIAISVYSIEMFASGIKSFDFHHNVDYSALENYTGYVQSSQRKLFDDIQEKSYEQDKADR